MVGDNLSQVRQRVEEAAKRSNRTLKDIILVAVTKTVEEGYIFEALDQGARDLGESRIQEVLLKFDKVNGYALKQGYKLVWHMIGHLQTNKAKDAVRMFDLIHSLDSMHLAVELDKQAKKIGKVQDVLLEVKTSPEATKYGFLPEEIEGALIEIAGLKNLQIKGLMTIAPFSDNAEKARPYFKQLKDLQVSLNKRTSDVGLRILSMGMTDDFEVAIEEGSDMVRIGRAIFGERYK
ncbi:MAG TPA: YggS family pyridoxal phosphate-dependent enzyme [Candidatus Omnitrophota bacterium]|nr:YggS family pyridoxal phosphate-dependent enzyme [Candidatus Omnitrophota bacterium]